MGLGCNGQCHQNLRISEHVSRFCGDEAGLGADDAVAEDFFALAEVVADGGLVVAEAAGDVAADFAQPFETVIVRRDVGGGRGEGGRVHGSVSRSWSGVMSCGVS